MLTVRQQQVLEFLRLTRDATGVMPSTREIQQNFGFASQTAAVEVLRALERKGSLRRLPGKARGIVLTEPGGWSGAVRVSVSEGGIDLSSAGDRHLYVDPRIVGAAPADALFAVRVPGDSLAGACILEGDYVVFDKTSPVADGDIVAALLNGSWVLKRYVITDGQAWLRSEHPERLQLIPAGEVNILGVMAGLVRLPPARRIEVSNGAAAAGKHRGRNVKPVEISQPLP